MRILNISLGLKAEDGAIEEQLAAQARQREQLEQEVSHF
jgi:hypothetical protein